VHAGRRKSEAGRALPGYRPAVRVALRSPGFRLLLAGQAVNATGNWVALIAIWGFATFRFDAGAADLAVLFAVLAVPGVVLGPVLGVPIDRLGPRRTLILANGLGFLDALALTQAQSYEAVILLALPLGVLEAFATASLDSLPPRLVSDKDLVSANALLGGADDLAIVVGPVVAALVNARWGLSGAFLVDAGTFLVGLAVAWPLKLAPGTIANAATPASTWRELREGVELARRVPGLRWTLGVAGATYLLWGLFGVLEPLYVRDVLGESDTVFALLQAVFGVGLVGSGITVAVIGDRVATPHWVGLATMASGVTAALYLGTRWLPIAAAGVFLWGAGVAFFYAPAKTLLQRYAPTPAHGRILSLNQSLEPLASMVTAPLAAALTVGIGVQAAGVAGGMAAVVAGLVALRRGRHLPPPPLGVRADPPAGSSDAVVARAPAHRSPGR
jgi:predicted MFS family arabinose efflux permease